MTPLAKPLGIKSLTIFGGVGQNPQVSGLRAGVDVIVACPGPESTSLRSARL